MEPARAAFLPNGKRLHLQHGPIDLIIGVVGPGRDQAYHRAAQRFQALLQQLVDELPVLRQPMTGTTTVNGPVAKRMLAASRPFAGDFITPMAAVAGAVADEILDVICADPAITKAYVNNGGDVAFHLTQGHLLTAAIATDTAAQVTLSCADPWRGIATSGWCGRSHSLGIADSVTVLARSAALADAAATMIANAVDLPGDPRIGRQPARSLAQDSDLGTRDVTVSVAALDPASRTNALTRGQRYGEDLRQRGVIGAAFLVLQGETRAVGQLPNLAIPMTERLDA